MTVERRYTLTISCPDCVRYGRDVEKSVLARALKYHLEDRVLLNGHRTIVFR